MKKGIYVFEDICSGCANCQMWCAFANKGEFNRRYSRIQLTRDVADGRFNIPMVNCTGKDCTTRNEKGEPLCVEMCPTGALVYTDADDAYKKRIELQQSREVQPLFKLIAPWKWPFPWREWPNEGE
jgi:Fe-S-cluster-containing dehydrogenase component